MSYFDTQERTLLHGTDGEFEGSYASRALYSLFVAFVVALEALNVFGIAYAPIGFKVLFLVLFAWDAWMLTRLAQLAKFCWTGDPF